MPVLMSLLCPWLCHLFFTVSRIRRESWWMAEGTQGLSMTREQPLFPKQGNGRNQSLQRRGKAGGW